MRLGVYGPNRRIWDVADYDAIEAAGVRDVIVRSDVAPEVVDILLSRGMTPYLQFTDYFAAHSQSDPAAQAMRLMGRCRERLPDGGYVILDNEPDLGSETAGQWGAEQWTRWYRAVYNVFRFYDDGGRYRLIYPAVSCRPGVDNLGWWRVGVANIGGHAGVGVHLYWDSPEWISGDSQSSRVGEFRAWAGLLPLFCLEFGSPTFVGDWPRRRLDYAAFGSVYNWDFVVGFPFILNPTPDWEHYAISGEQLIELARAWPGK